jgi:hypothetical protein
MNDEERKAKLEQMCKALEPTPSFASTVLDLTSTFYAVAISTVALGMASQSLKVAGLLEETTSQ